MNAYVRSTTIVLLSVFAARGVTFTSDTTIDFTNATYDGVDVVVTNCTVTINGPHAFASLRILNGGRVTHQAYDTGLFYSSFQTNEPIILNGTNAVALSQTNVTPSSIVVSNLAGTITYTNGVDYLLGFGPQGITTLQRTDTSSIPDGDTVSVMYTSSVLLGRSGLNLNVAGDLLLESGGTIDVTGRGYSNGFGPGKGSSAGSFLAGSGGAYGGSGGLSASNAPGGIAYGLLLQPDNKGSEGGAGTLGTGGAGGGAVKLNVGGLLRVNGAILANGLSATNERAGGGAGGGVWLTAQTLAGSGSITANGGDGEPAQGGGGGGGRIGAFYQTNTFTGQLSARGGRGFQSGGAGTIFAQPGLLAGTAIIDNAGRLGATTPFSTTQALALTIKSGALVSLSIPQTINSLMLFSNGWISASNSVLTVLGDAAIAGNSGITADATGYPGGSGPGAGRFATGVAIVGGGGGYGGGGASAVGTNTLGGGCYGSVTQPSLPGSGGGRGNGTSPYNLGGAGGGGIVLNVGGTLFLDGRISAGGGPGIGQGSGGGSGGSVWLNLGSFSGSGTVSACGGLGNDLGGSGGGGRIALNYASSDFSGTVQAFGGAIGTNAAGAGTIYVRPAGQSAGQLLIDNGGHLATAGSVFTSQEALSLTVQGGAIATPTSTILGSLWLNNNGWLRLTNLSMSIQGDANVSAGCGIIADGTGFGAGLGTGAGRSLSATIPGGGVVYYGGGGGYGGYGGYGGSGVSGGGSYGSISAPLELGSGGGNATDAGRGGSGGGALRLTITGTLNIDGRVSSDGSPSVGLNAGGGSGGTVTLTVGTLAGSGLISANGGAGTGIGGGGGGGRIAITYTTSIFNGAMHAYGASGGSSGTAGTIYLKGSSQLAPQLIIDNGGIPGQTAFSTTSGTLDLTLRGGSIVSNMNSGVIPNINNLFIGADSWLLFSGSPGPIVNTLTINGSATIETGGGITADGGGYTGAVGPGAGRSYYLGNTNAGSGGGYGGYGGPALGGAGGNGYGSALSSPQAGSGGGTGKAGGISGGAGGGSLMINVRGLLLLHGRISANGRPGVPGTYGGGGSGGAVFLNTGTLMGDGAISASGGNGDGFGGGGGGGRIMLLPAVNLFAGTATAYGGGGASRGGAGTVFIGAQSPSANFGQVIADNGGLPGTNTYIQDSGTFDLNVRGAASVLLNYYSVSLQNLFIGSNSWVWFNYPQGNPTLIASGGAVIEAGGGIRADGVGGRPESGQGAGRTYSFGTTNVGSGGGYGGYGGAAGVPGAPGGTAYGQAISAPLAGSGGGSAGTSGGGSGGGSITLRVTGSLTLDGKISADGTAGFPGNTGGGSGGSVYITAATLLGSGSISANGGPASGLGGGGGGGRIMLLPNVNSFFGTVTAFGGGGYARGGAGTIYSANASPAGQLPGLLLADNGGLLGTNTLIMDNARFDLTTEGGAKVYLSSSAASPRNVYVASNSWLLLPTNPVLLNISGNAVIEAGGTLFADGLGYRAGSGPGAGYIYNNIRGGGGYGGYGGGAIAQVTSGGGASYGSYQTPNQWGSGGGIGSPQMGGPGGGAIMLNVTGILDVEGSISANGLAGAQNNGGGSGGSIWLTAGTLLGSGLITANGGAGLGLAGGGGGGRIALIYGTNFFNGLATAFGGNGYVDGGAGTVYIAPKSSPIPNQQLVIDNGGNLGENTGLSGGSSSLDLTIRNGGIAWAISGFNLRNLVVGSNGWFTFHTPSSVLVSGNATVQAGGGIIADGTTSQGVGAGHSAVAALGTGGSGGGHGGTGGASATGAAGGGSYGSIFQPLTPGSGGGNGVYPALGGAGGGVVSLNVIGTLQVDGRVSADGADGNAPGGGGGSGGTVSLTVRNLAGTGLISANGGVGDGLGGGGGGGRIRLSYLSKTFAGMLTAYGGAGAAWGGAGTIYTLPTGQSGGVILIDNNGHFGTNTPVTTVPAAPGVIPSLTIQDGGIATLASPQTYWSNLLINAGGTLTAVLGTTNVEVDVLHNARIDAGGALNLNGLGFAQALGPGAGLSSHYVGSGAGYGGIGGTSSLSPGGPTYGSAQQPVVWGSGGGLGWGSPGPGSEGGGALHLSVGGTLTVNGALSANGNAGVQDDAGGGSGGSIWIEASTLTGAGSVSTDGGTGELFDGGGGGGGRVAIYSRNNIFAGRLSAAGAFGYNPGEDGTIYMGSSFAAPTVVSQLPSGRVTNAVAIVELDFNTTLNPFSLSPTDFTLLTPAGTPPTNYVAVYMLDDKRVQLQFIPGQSAIGDYTLLVGTNILDLFGQPMSQVYRGAFSISVPVIQGTVADLEGHPVAGVLIDRNDGYSLALTDTNGNYVLGIPTGGDVTVMPSFGNLVFVPGSVVYTNVTASISNQNFLVVSSIAPALSVQPSSAGLGMSWFGIPGVTYQPLVSSNLVDWVPYGPAIVGTNGMMQLVLPVGSDPQDFYRLRANN